MAEQSAPLETFLRGMETKVAPKLIVVDTLTLKPSLEGWKRRPCALLRGVS